ncbi:MAG: acetate--CoA ligase family protein [Candidatus Altiarchaeota archaeon]
MTTSIFDAKSIAVVGASKDKRKVGHAVIYNLKSTFNGRLYPVNPKEDRILGLKCHPTVKSIGKKVDMAVIAVPAKIVPSILEDCGKSKIKNAVIISAGFKEAGKDGGKLEIQCLKIAKKHGIRILGPNCLGVIDTESGLNATFASQKALRGNIAFMSQSGALCTAILDWAEKERIGFSKFVSLGNKADLSENDFLQAFLEDKNTKVILTYLEGFAKGEEFIRLARHVSKSKPIVLLKAGRTAAGARAVASHTGTLAGSDSAYDAAFRKAGVIRVDNIEELFDYAIAFTTQPIPKSENVGILTNAGGPGIIATDACERKGLTLSTFSRSTVAKLSKGLPPAANIYNPVDVLGDALEDRYEYALKTMLQDGSVHSMIVLLTPQLMTDSRNVANVIIKAAEKSKKPILCSFIGGVKVEQGSALLKRASIPNYQFPEKAVSSLKSLVTYNQIRRRKMSKPPMFRFREEQIGDIIGRHVKAGKVNIGLESLDILRHCGIRTCRSFTAKNADEAVSFQKKLKGQVAMKIVSDDILHKTDIGCVALNVREHDVRATYNRIVYNALRYMPHASIDGVLVQEMVGDSKEVIVGVSKDPQVGHLVMFGLGGIYVEVLKDVSFGVTPLTDDEALSMIEDVRGYGILKGVRGEAQSDISSIKDVLLRVSQLSKRFPEIVELDINPLKVFETGKGCVAVDARIILKK